MGSSPEDTRRYEYGFSPDGAIRAARESLSDLRDLVPDGTLEQLRLLASELVTNAVRHTGLGSDTGPDGHVGLALVVSPATVRLEVTDPGPGFDAPEHPSPNAREGSGYGLFLVDSIADRWGVESGESTRVWLELDYGA